MVGCVLRTIAAGFVMWVGGAGLHGAMATDFEEVEGSWKVGCYGQATTRMEVEVPKALEGADGLVILRGSRVGLEAGREWVVSEMAWGGDGDVRWCVGSDQWSCEEAVEGRFTVRSENERTVRGDIAVRLSSGKSIEVRFRAMRADGEQPGCA